VFDGPFVEARGPPNATQGASLSLSRWPRARQAGEHLRVDIATAR
jgi:hypothetical protein